MDWAFGFTQESVKMAESTLFIPDITGFTQFVRSTEISHGQHIIEELINLLIRKGKEKFEVAEIEGDAIFFFHKEKLSEEEVLGMAHSLFVDFHSHLLRYGVDRICSCGACASAVDLKLKFIVHAGEIGMARYAEGNPKPFGDAVIGAHRLLKNSVPLDQYVLMSDDFISSDNEYDASGTLEDPDLGPLTFKYLDINHWQQESHYEPVSLIHEQVDLELEDRFELDAKSEELYPFVVDFKYRKLWNEGATRIEFDENVANHQGATHYCVVNNKDLFFNTVKPKSESSNILSYGETLRNPKPLKYLEVDYFIEPLDLDRSEVHLVLRASVSNGWQRLLLPLIRRRMKGQLKLIQKSLTEGFRRHRDLVLEDYFKPVADLEASPVH